MVGPSFGRGVLLLTTTNAKRRYYLQSSMLFVGGLVLHTGN